MAQPAKKTAAGKGTNGKSKSVAQQPEVITPHTVIEELPLEKVIENKLAENNVTKRVLNAMKSKFLVPAKEEGDKLVLKEEYKLKNPTDKETYLMIKEERRNVRKVGIIAEKVCEKGRADAVQIQRLWIGREKEVKGEIEIVQDQLDEQIKIFEDEEKRLIEVEEKRKDEQLIVRQSELIKKGAVNANGCMNINDLSIENSSIREADDEDYKETILPLFQMHYEKNEQARVAEETEKKRQQEEFEKKQNEMKQQQEEFEKKQNEFKQQQEQFQKQQQELQQQKIKNRRMQLEALGMTFSFKDDSYVFADVNIHNSTELCLWDDAAWETKLLEIKPVIEQRKVEAKQKEERKTARAAQLSELGMTFTGTAYKFEDVNIPGTDLSGMNDTDWNELIATTTPIIADRKQKAEDKKKQEWEKQQQEEQQRQQQQQQEEQAKAGDKENWAALITTLSSVAIPEFKSNIYKGKAAQLLTKIKEIQSL